MRNRIAPPPRRVLLRLEALEDRQVLSGFVDLLPRLTALVPSATAPASGAQPPPLAFSAEAVVTEGGSSDTAGATLDIRADVTQGGNLSLDLEATGAVASTSVALAVEASTGSPASPPTGNSGGSALTGPQGSTDNLTLGFGTTGAGIPTGVTLAELSGAPEARASQETAVALDAGWAAALEDEWGWADASAGFAAADSGADALGPDAGDSGGAQRAGLVTSSSGREEEGTPTETTLPTDAAPDGRPAVKGAPEDEPDAPGTNEALGRFAPEGFGPLSDFFPLNLTDLRRAGQNSLDYLMGARESGKGEVLSWLFALGAAAVIYELTSRQARLDPGGLPSDGSGPALV